MNNPPTQASAPEPLQILMLAPQPFFQERGTPIAVRMLSEELASAGNAVDLLVFHEGEPLDSKGVGLYRTPAIPGLKGIRPGFSFKKLICDGLLFFKSLILLRRKKYQVIHAVEEAVFIAFVLQLLFDIPYVCDMDSLLSLQLSDSFPILGRISGVMEWFEKKVTRRSAGVVAVCKSLEEKAGTFAPEVPVLRLEDVSLLDGGATCLENIRQEHSLSGSLVMYVGNLERYQGIDLLLHAFTCLPEQLRQAATLVVIGGKPADITSYRALADSLGLHDQVLFLGPRPVQHLACYLRQADILVSPRTQGNNTPMKIYSYLDSGRPVLATRLATHTQVLDDQIAQLAEPEPHAFAQALAELIDNRPLRQRLAQAAQQRVAAEYSREAFRRKVRRFYGDIAVGLSKERQH